MLRPRKQLSIQHIMQQMAYVQSEERAEAKETVEHPAYNAADGVCSK
jgi:hypothetical protein